MIKKTILEVENETVIFFLPFHIDWYISYSEITVFIFKVELFAESLLHHLLCNLNFGFFMVIDTIFLW